MSGSIQEVPMPGSTASPEHTMSPEGTARLAALEAGLVTKPDELNVSAGTSTEAPAVEDVSPAEKVESEPTDRATPPSNPTTIAPLEGISEKYAPLAAEYQADLAAIADEHSSLPPGELSTLFAFVGGRAAADMAREEQGSTLYNGQVGGPNLANADECRHRLMTAFGDMAGAIMNAAKTECDKLPAKVRQWLDADQGNGRRLGNHPDVVLGLALRPFAKLSADAAAKELATIRSSADYQMGNKLSIAKASMLQLVVERGKNAAPDPKPQAPGIISPKPGHTWGTRDAAYPTQGTDAAAKLRAELNTLSRSLTDSKSDLSSNPKKRKEAIDRRQEINAKLGSGA